MSKPEILLVDLDGTVANCEHRKRYIDDVIRVGDTVYIKGEPNSKSNPYVVRDVDAYGDVLACRSPNWRKSNGQDLRKKKDYKRFFESCRDDSPIQTTIDIVRSLSREYQVLFCSGRPDSCRVDTARWLNLNGLWYPNDRQLFMRPSGDMRQDYIVKEELYRKHIEPFYTVKLVLDDRDSVVNMWRNTLGLTCWQVAPGAF